MAVTGYAILQVSLAVLVELEGQLVQQEASVRLLLAAVAPKCELLVLHVESSSSS